MTKPQQPEQTELQQINNTDSYISMALGLAVVLVIGIFIYNFATKRQNETESNTNTQETAEQKDLTQDTLTTHTVTKGETLWSISERYYKSGYNWVDIVKANNLKNANSIEAGQSITIPVTTPIIPQTGTLTEQAATINKPKNSTYTVVKGDDLWNIAVREYGSGYKWVDIAKSNNLANPNIIHAGNVLSLP